MNRETHQREDRFLTYIVLTVFATLVAGFVWVSFTSDSVVEQGEASFEPHQSDVSRLADAPNAPAPADASRGRDAHLLRFVTPSGPVPIRATLGGPGVHPAFEATSATGVVPVPLTYEGTQTPALEAMVVSRDEEWVFWDFVQELDESNVLEPSTAVSITVSSDGEPIEGARVRLSRKLLSFVRMDETTDAFGLVRFEPVPQGPYVIDVDAPGYLRETRRIHAEESHVELERGVMLTGRVSAQRAPVPDAFVVVWVRDELGFERPEDIVSTDSGGEFRTFGLPAVEARVVAYHEAFVPTASEWVTLTRPTARLDVQMKPGLAVGVRVEDETGGAVEHALVTWNDEATRESGAKVTDQNGRARFGAVPPEAVFTARLQRFRAGPKSPQVVDGGEAEVRLTLSSADASSGVLLRITGISDVVVTRIEAEVDGEPCPTDELETGTWQVGCEGEGLLRVFTRYTGYHETRMAFGETLEWQLPEPAEYEVIVKGPFERPDWANVSLEVLWGETWHPLMWSATETGSARTITNLLPATYQARIRASGYVEERFEWSARQKAQVILEPELVVSLRVTDERGALLTGSYLRLWRDGAPVSDLKRSAGELPVTFRGPAESARILAVDPRRGEQVTRVADASDVIALVHPVLTTSLDGRPDRDTLESWLGEDLVADENGVQIDVVKTDSPASKAGIPRGAWVVDAFVGATGRPTLVYWTRNGYETVDLQL